VTFARKFEPYISQDSADYLVEQYKKLRQRDSSGEGEGEGERMEGFTLFVLVGS